MAVESPRHADLDHSLEFQAEVLSGLVPITPHYATVPIAEGFNWSDQFARITSGQWYLVVFRSVHRATADAALLTEIDERAYREALSRPGLLHYFRGMADAQGACLSFCIWTRQEEARHARAQPEHQAAMQLLAAMFESYQLERYLLGKRAGGRLTLERLDSGITHYVSPALDPQPSTNWHAPVHAAEALGGA
jgi:hypothetical protein